MLVRVLTMMVLVTSIAVPAVASAADDDHDPCKIALCLANPNGAKAVSECVPPIVYLQKRLAEGKSVPKCDMGGGGSAEQKGDTVVFTMPGQETQVFNWKTGQSYTMPAQPAPTPPSNPKDGGHVREQLK